jgi:membrane protease YdiL (CAAX protease family)
VLNQERTKFYLVSMAVQWVLAAACWLVVWLDGQSLAEIGLRLFEQVSTTVMAGLGVTAVLAVIVGLIWWLQYTRRWRESGVLMAILPETLNEKMWFMALAATAGFCEEILYRGFAITRLALLTGGVWSAAGTAVIVFSAGHVYQGAIGVGRAGALGAVLAITFIITGSLIPGMIAHFLIDALAGLWGKKLLAHG